LNRLRSRSARRMKARSLDHSHRFRRWPFAVAAACSAVVTSLALGGVPPSGCTSIQNIPVAQSIQFNAGIVQIFINFNGMANGCADCHTSMMGNMFPSGGLDLDPADSPSPYVNLINMPSFDAPDQGLTYVIPNHPEQSFLFQKVNCDTPPEGTRMPFNNYAGGLTVQQQALIYDWIAAGAPVGTTDDIFRGTFDVRGFDQ
jgi:hypothetical protein